VAGLFLPQGAPFVETSTPLRPGRRALLRVLPPPPAPAAAGADAAAGGPVAGRGAVAVVLDGGSASCSEFLAAALRDEVRRPGPRAAAAREA